MKLFFLFFFLEFFVFLFLRQVSYNDLPIVFEHLDTLWAERNFSLDLCAFVILKNLLTISSFLVQVVFKSLFFHDLGFIYLKKSHKCF